MAVSNDTNGSVSSKTLTAIVWLGVAAFITGIVMLILGISDKVEFTIKVLGQELTCTSSGLIVMVAGIVLMFAPMVIRPGFTPFRVLRGQV